MNDGRKMASKRVWRLASDVTIKPVTEMPEDVIEQITRGEKNPEDQFALERKKARTHPKIVNRDVMDVLNYFGTEGATYEETLNHFVKLKGLSREELDPNMRKMINDFIRANFLVEGSRENEKTEAIEPEFEDDDEWLSYRIIENVHVIIDSEIYRVRHIPSGELRALKISRNSFPRERMRKKIIERLRHEFSVIEEIDHPNTVKVYEYGEHQGRMYGILDWVDGSSVRSFAYSSEEDPSGELLLRLSIECLESLDAVHSVGYLHGDVHTGNFLVKKGHVCLIDFGLSRPIRITEEEMKKYPEGGVAHYLPPEYVRNKNQKKRKPWGSVPGEIYSSGVMLYTLFTGRYPYRGAFYRKDYMNSIVNDPPLSFEDNQAEPWPEVEAALHRAMAKDPSDRFNTAGEFAEELKRIKNSI